MSLASVFCDILGPLSILCLLRPKKPNYLYSKPFLVIFRVPFDFITSSGHDTVVPVHLHC
jgi:hypothetical protein